MIELEQKLSQKELMLLVGEGLEKDPALERVLLERDYSMIAVSDLEDASIVIKRKPPFITFVKLSLVTDQKKLALLKGPEDFSFGRVVFIVDLFSDEAYLLAREIKSSIFIFPPFDGEKLRSLLSTLHPENKNPLPVPRKSTLKKNTGDIIPIAQWTQDFSAQKKFLEENIPLKAEKNVQAFLLENHRLLHACTALTRILEADRRTLDFFCVSSPEALQVVFQDSFSSKNAHFFATQCEALFEEKSFFQKKILLNLTGRSTESQILVRWSIPFDSTDYSTVHVVALDISTICQNLRELELQKGKFEKIFQSSPAGIVISDPSLKTLEVNNAFVKMFGFASKDEVMGQFLGDLVIPPKYHAQFLSICRMALDGKRVFIETQRRRKDGRIIDVFLNSSPLEMPGGIAAICFLYIDISERKREEMLLKRKLKIEQMVSEISADILNYPSLESALRGALPKMASYIAADRVSHVIVRKGVMRYSSEWCRHNVPSLKALYEGEREALPLQKDPWFCANLETGDTFNIEFDEKAGLAEEAMAIQNFMSRHKIGSFLVIPYRFRGEVDGFIVFEKIKSSFNWTNEEIGLFNLFSEMLSSLKDRDAAYEMLRQDREKYRLLFWQISEPFMVFDIIYDEFGTPSDVRFVELNEQAKRFLKKHGYDEVLGRSFLEIFPGAESVFKEKLNDVIAKEEPQTLSFYNDLFNCSMTISYFVPHKEQLVLLVSHTMKES